MARQKASVRRAPLSSRGSLSDMDYMSFPPDAHSPAPQQSARLMLRSSAAKASPHATRSSIINSITSMVTANSNPPLATSAKAASDSKFGPADLKLTKLSSFPMRSSERQHHESENQAQEVDEEGDNEEGSDGDDEEGVTPCALTGSTSFMDGLEGGEGFTAGSGRRSKTTYTREEKLEALERYHRVVEQAAAVKPVGSSSGAKPNRTRVTIMDGARMAGVEYQTFRNWLRAEEEIRKQAPGSKNLKRSRRSTNLSGDRPGGTTDVGPDGEVGDEEMTDLLPDQSGLHPASDLVQLGGMHESAVVNKNGRPLRQVGDGGRVVKRSSNLQRLSKSTSHMSLSGCPSSFSSQRASPVAGSSVSSSSLHSDSPAGVHGHVLASSVDKYSFVSLSASVRSSRVRMSALHANSDVDACTVVCSNIGHNGSQARDVHSPNSQLDIQQLSHPQLITPVPFGGTGSGTDLASDHQDGTSKPDRAAPFGTRLVRSEVSHACIEGPVWLINCTVKNSRIVGNSVTGAAGVSRKDSSATTPSASTGSTNNCSNRAVPQKDCLVLSNCRIENATVVGGCGVVFDGEALRDGVFEQY